MYIRPDQLSEMRKLIGLHGDTRRPKLPLQVHNWQLRHSVKCVQHSGTGEYVFIVGGTASHFWEHFGQHRRDMQSFDVGRFQSYLNTGKIWTTAAGGQKVQIGYYSPKGSDVRWTLVQPPEHILHSAFVCEVRADALPAVGGAPHALDAQRLVRCLPRLVFRVARAVHARSTFCPMPIRSPQPEHSQIQSAALPRSQEARLPTVADLPTVLGQERQVSCAPRLVFRVEGGRVSL